MVSSTLSLSSLCMLLGRIVNRGFLKHLNHQWFLVCSETSVTYSYTMQYLSRREFLLQLSDFIAPDAESLAVKIVLTLIYEVTSH